LIMSAMPMDSMAGAAAALVCCRGWCEIGDGHLIAVATSQSMAGASNEDIPTKLLPHPLHDDQDVVAKNKSNEVRIGPMTRAHTKQLEV
jgi:hypothetical protein